GRFSWSSLENRGSLGGVPCRVNKRGFGRYTSEPPTILSAGIDARLWPEKGRQSLLLHGADVLSDRLSCRPILRSRPRAPGRPSEANRATPRFSASRRPAQR